MKRPRLKRWFPVWLRWVSGFLLLPVAFFLFTEWRAERDWQNYCKEARARGVKLTLEEFLPKEPIPDEDNFAAIPIFKEAIKTKGTAVGSAAFRQIEVIPRFELPIGFKKSKALKPRWIGPEKLDMGGVRRALIESGILHTKDIEGDDAGAVIRGLKKVEPELTQIHEAAGRPLSVYPIAWNSSLHPMPFDHLRLVSKLNRILYTKICAELSAGNSTQALDDLNDLFALCRSLEAEPALLPYLVQKSSYQIALKGVWEGLNAGKWNDTELLEIEKCLAAVNPIKRYRYALESERGYLNTSKDEFVKNRFSSTMRKNFFGGMPNDLLGWLTWTQSYTLSYWRDIQLWDNRQTDKELPAWDGIGERWKMQSIAKDEGKQMGLFKKIRLHLVTMLDGILGSAGESTLKQHVQIRLAGLACALERFKNVRGSYPDQLEALVPDFLQKLPREPFDGKPFRYRRTEDGSYLLYSIGMDLKDDGGVLNKDTSKRYDAADQPDWLWWAPGQVERENAEVEKKAK